MIWDVFVIIPLVITNKLFLKLSISKKIIFCCLKILLAKAEDKTCSRCVHPVDHRFKSQIKWQITKSKNLLTMIWFKLKIKVTKIKKRSKSKFKKNSKYLNNQYKLSKTTKTKYLTRKIYKGSHQKKIWMIMLIY